MAVAEPVPYMNSYLDGSPSPEPAPRARNGLLPQIAPRDELDDLFGEDLNIDEIFRDIDKNGISKHKKTTGGAAARARSSSPLGELGIDKEIQITKKKRVNVKLDEERLLSQAGIPKLRRIAKERLRFKGKGHEYSDAARILSLYQLWLDDLFPKAKFADALTIVEKLGHTKRMQVMRKAWIEGKASQPTQEKSGDEMERHNGSATGNLVTAEEGSAVWGRIFSQGGKQNGRPQTPPRQAGRGETEDLYGASPRIAMRPKPAAKRSGEGSGGLFVSDDDDELEELMKEVETNAAPRQSLFGGGDAPGAPATNAKMADFEDELEALMAMEDAGEGPTIDAPLGSKNTNTESFEDELEAMMEMEGCANAPTVPAMGPEKQIAEDFDDDELEAMMGVDDDMH